MNLGACCLTDVGKVRLHNEDCFGDFPALGLWIVCDGMGGHDAGEVASAIAIEVVEACVQQGRELKDAILQAHQAVLEAPLLQRGRPGMGTTIVALHLQNAEYTICWVGDSRAYLWGRELKRLTRDHSYVQSLIDAGVISEDEARRHPQRNVITQALGAGSVEEMQIGLIRGRFAQGESILLCSDGLTGELDDEEISAIMSNNGNLQDKAHVLLQTALSKGGADNITVLLIEPSQRSKTAPRQAIETRPAFDS